MIKLRIIALLLVLIGATPIATPPAALPAETVITGSFPDPVAFSASLPINPAEINQIMLLLQVGASQTPLALVAGPDDMVVGDDGVQVHLPVMLQDFGLPPGLTVRAHWEITMRDGGLIRTTTASMDWVDGRYAWTETRGDGFRLHSYGLSDSFLAEITSMTDETVRNLTERYHLSLETPIAIWIYPESEAFSASRPANSREAVAGFSVSPYGVILATVPDGNIAEFGRVVPHEISHQMLAGATDNAYATLPVWFDEGMATQTQIGGTGGFLAMAQSALADDRLIALSSLEYSFPFDRTAASLAYAESWSAIEFMRSRWGDDGVSHVIATLADGAPIDDALSSALGLTEPDFEHAWREWLASANGA